MKRVYIGYRFSTERDKLELRKRLEKLSVCFNGLGFETFIFYRDVEHWKKAKLSKKEIIFGALEELKKSDVFCFFNDYPDKGEGVILETGFAKALDKKIIFLNCCGAGYNYIGELADKIVNAESFEDLLNNLSKNKCL